MSLVGKTAVITGGGTGIGAACARGLAGQGCRGGVGYLLKLVGLPRAEEVVKEVELFRLEVVQQEKYAAGIKSTTNNDIPADILLHSSAPRRLNVPNRAIFANKRQRICDLTNETWAISDLHVKGDEKR